MSVTRALGTSIAASLLLASAACGDDESAQGAGGSGSSTDATTSTGATNTEPCPEFAPGSGDPCSPPEGGTCHYEEEGTCPDGSMTGSSIDLTCEDGAWARDVTRSSECCPAAPEQSGAQACFIEGTTCNYLGDVVCPDGGTTGGNVVATCDGTRWQTVYEPTGGVCEGETACPSSPPSTGDECDSALFQSDCIWEVASPCLDGPGFNVITVARCSSVPSATGAPAWSVGTLFEGEECGACNGDSSDPCPFAGLACVTTFGCFEAAGSYDQGTICVGGSPEIAWTVENCE